MYSRSAKTVVFAILGAVNFVILVDFSLQNVQKFIKNHYSEPLNKLNWQILHFQNPQNWFHVKSATFQKNFILAMNGVKVGNTVYTSKHKQITNTKVDLFSRGRVAKKVIFEKEKTFSRKKRGAEWFFNFVHNARWDISRCWNVTEVNAKLQAQKKQWPKS